MRKTKQNKCELNNHQQITLKQMRVKELVEGCN